MHRFVTAMPRLHRRSSIQRLNTPGELGRNSLGSSRNSELSSQTSLPDDVSFLFPALVIGSVVFVIIAALLYSLFWRKSKI